MPIALLALAAFAGGVLVARGQGANQRAVARQYVRDWSRSDWPAMYALLDAGSRRAMNESAFLRAYRRAASISTLTAVSAGRVGTPHHGVVDVVTAARTRLFGTLRAPLIIPLTSDSSGTHVHFVASLLFPGLRPGEHLSRRMVMAPRAALLADDGTPLAQGPTRSSPIPDVAGAIAGVLGPVPADQTSTYVSLGYPTGTHVGLDGLERIFQTRLAGSPGGTLRAGGRVLAHVAPRPGTDVRTTIDPAIERAVTGAMAGRYAGVVALDPRSGAVLAAAGIAFSGLQPPGSTMKIVTATGVLAAGLAHIDDTYPVATQAIIDGFALQNANGEACGGRLIDAFAASCNSVFAPLGVRLGASRFLATAKRFGFDRPSPIPSEPQSSIPPTSLTRGALELGASAIGQGRVQATALEMADVAATIAMGGRRPVPTLVAGAPARFVPVTTAAVAADVQRMMVAVVNSTQGTGIAAAIPGVLVAGKTGTAELRTTVTTPNNPNASNPANTDSWFVGYAPVGAARIVVGALFPGQGAGGQTAAPAARLVLEAGLTRR